MQLEIVVRKSCSMFASAFRCFLDFRSFSLNGRRQHDKRNILSLLLLLLLCGFRTVFITIIIFIIEKIFAYSTPVHQPHHHKKCLKSNKKKMSLRFYHLKFNSAIKKKEFCLFFAFVSPTRAES